MSVVQKSGSSSRPLLYGRPSGLREVQPLRRVFAPRTTSTESFTLYDGHLVRRVSARRTTSTESYTLYDGHLVRRVSARRTTSTESHTLYDGHLVRRILNEVP